MHQVLQALVLGYGRGMQSYLHRDAKAEHYLKLLMHGSLAVQSAPGSVVDVSCLGFQAAGFSTLKNIGAKLWSSQTNCRKKYSITISPGLLLLLPLFLFLLPALYFMISAIYINRRRGSNAAVTHP